MSNLTGPALWGPHGWKFIHYITLGYPYNATDETKTNYLNFFNTLKNVIPCSICGNNYKEHLLEFPLTLEILSDKQAFINWGITMHNLVNLSNNKKEYSNEEGLAAIKAQNIGDCPGYTDFSIEKPIESFDNGPDKKNNLFIIIIVILIIVIAYLLLNKK
jgi:hypothetical protein